MQETVDLALGDLVIACDHDEQNIPASSCRGDWLDNPTLLVIGLHLTPFEALGKCTDHEKVCWIVLDFQRRWHPQAPRGPATCPIFQVGAQVSGDEWTTSLGYCTSLHPFTRRTTIAIGSPV